MSAAADPDADSIPPRTAPLATASPPQSRLTSADVLRTAALVVGMLIAILLAWVSREILLTTFLGVLFGLAVAAATDRLERVRVPRGLGAALIVFLSIGALYGTGALIAPTLASQGALLRERVPEAVDRIEGWMHDRPGLASLLLGGRDVTAAGGTMNRSADISQARTTSHAAGDSAEASAVRAKMTDSVSAVPTLRGRVAQQLTGVSRYLFPFLSSTVTVVAGLFLIVVLAIYVGASPRQYHRGLVLLFPRDAQHRAGVVLSRLAAVLRKWLVTQLIAMIAIGVVTTVTLLVLGVKSAFALGVIAGLLEFVPTVGPILSAVPAVAMGFLDSPQKALSVAIAYLVIQQVEGNILIPMLMKEGMDLPPALTIVAQAIMALVFGFLGLLVAVPLLAAIVVPIRLLYVDDARASIQP